MANVSCGWASIDERGKASGGKDGDQTGKEVKVGNWYYFKQTIVFRWKSRELAEKYAKIIKAFCTNDNIGYDQSERTTLFNILKAANWKYTKVTKPVECDCSELVACAINCTVGKEVVPSWIYTGNLATLLERTGLFETALTGEKYCKSNEYLATGDIINAPNHHVISVLADGPKVGVTSKAEGGSLAAEPTLKKGSIGSQVKKLQRNLNTLKITDADGKPLTVDGAFGACTHEAVKKFQKKYGLTVDGIYGQKSYGKMKTLIK